MRRSILIPIFCCIVHSILALNAGCSTRQRFDTCLFSSSKEEEETVSFLEQDNTTGIEAEVVGASGRLGSQWMRLLAPTARAVTRGLCPGTCWTVNEDQPIYVATPSASWKQIYQVTPSHRRNDLVWIGNGLLLSSEIHRNATVVVPHYGILSVGAKPITSLTSPPTFVYGRHATRTADLLNRDGIRVEILTDWNDIQVAAGRKLLWASCLWLLCHYPHASNDNTSSLISVSQVHKHHSAQLERLVRELWKTFQARVLLHQQNEENLGEEVEEILATLEYMRNYSDSMPHAIPSLDLAKSELAERNGMFIDDTSKELQPFHYHLLETVLKNTSLIETLLQSSSSSSSHTECDDTVVVSLPFVNLSVYGRKRQSRGGISKVPDSGASRRIAIVGGGILGSCIAMNLARMMEEGTDKKTFAHHVTVIDQQPPSSLGQTTRGSWAWLNANQKSPPPSYQWLNQLGMRSWHNDLAIAHLPTWNGSLVLVGKPLDATTTTLTGYPCYGPLSCSQIQQLEPACIFSSPKHQTQDNDDTCVYYFPEEGFVDPMDAVRTMRQLALTSGKVSFLPNHKVRHTIRKNQPDGEFGLVCEALGEDTITTIPTDVIVAAAGIGSQMPCLGGIPLLNTPGTIALAKPATTSPPTNSGGDTNPNPLRLLSRVLVDAYHESHILQRVDGTIAIGGGYPQVGGASAKHSGSISLDASSLVSAAAQYIAPTVLEHVENESVETVNEVRPMPLDGYPSIGFVQMEEEGDGRVPLSLYSAVTHSGITLAPLLGALISAELCYDMDLVMLRPWRPQRFNQVK